MMWAASEEREDSGNGEVFVVDEAEEKYLKCRTMAHEIREKVLEKPGEIINNF